MPQNSLAAAAAFLIGGLFATQSLGRDPQPLKSGEPGTPTAKPPLAELNLPKHFEQLIQDRSVIDGYQIQNHRVEDAGSPTPVSLSIARNRNPQFVRTVQSQPGVPAAKYRSGLSQKLVPPRGYRASILDRVSEIPSWPGRTNQSETELAASARVSSRLAHDGIISTLAQIMTILGPGQFLTNGALALRTLEDAGFPADLLACFAADGRVATTKRVLEVVRRVARRVSEGASSETIRAEFEKVPFHFQRASSDYRVATEGGRHELGLVRMQAGGGYRKGIVPGGSVDAINQIISAVPLADFLISVPSEMAEPFQEMARQSWRLRRAEQARIIAELMSVAAWAQDNGKAGTVGGGASGPARAATLAPRYACTDEGHSTFEPGESFLMDGLRTAGHEVVQSSLLFQGGNVLAALDPKSGQRILLVGEGEVYRNIALGLTHAQVLEAFRAEFGVDRVTVVPAVSYHLDFDICFRAGTNSMVLFVNDTMAAVRIILDLGVGALQRHGSLDANTALKVRTDLAAGRDADALSFLTNAVRRLRHGRTNYPAALARCFAPDRVDSPSGNLQCFLLALDLLEASILRDDTSAADRERIEYLRALQRLEAARRRQTEDLKRLGWTIVTIPSMPDLYRSINYLNGIHHRDGYLFPAFKGFYTPLDQAATAAFRNVLGPDVRITPIHTSECQRQNGGVHCLAAVYPKL